MKNESITFGGMDRNSFADSVKAGMCEEMINARSENGSVRIIPKKKSLGTVDYDDIIYHSTSTALCLIGHRKSSGKHVFERFDDEDCTVIGVISDTIPSENEIYYSCINNFFVVSDKTYVRNNLFIFDGKTDSGYSTFFSFFDSLDITPVFNITHPQTGSIPTITKHWQLHEFYDVPENTEFIYMEQFRESKVLQDNVKDSVTALINKSVQENEHYAEGYVVTAVTMTLWDGSEIPTGGFRAFPLDKAFLMDSPGIDSDRIQNLVIIKGDTEYKYSNYYLNGWITEVYMETFGGLSFHIATMTDLRKYSDVIRSINLYCSVPLSRTDWDRKLTIHKKSNTELYIHTSERTLDDGECDKQLLYLQKSWNITDTLPSATDRYQIRFSKEQSSERTLDVMSSTRRAGNMFAYNRRLHFFDTRCMESPDKTSIMNMFTTYPQEKFEVDDIRMEIVTAYVFLRINGMIKVARYDGIIAMTTSLTHVRPASYSVPNMQRMFIVNDSRAYRVVFRRSDGLVADFNLHSSAAYNYSFGYYNSPRFYSDNQSVKEEIAEYASSTETITYGEDTDINVTAQGNPVVFPVNNSYSVDHRIVDMAVAYEEISAVQTGQYPVYVFTEKGIYAMEQGGGDVLYGRIVPINSDEVSGNVKQTRHGIAYVSNDRIMLISGRQSEEISLLLDGEPDYRIRENSGGSYRKCCCNPQLYDMSQFISKYPSATDRYRYLRKFVQGCTINFSSYEDEIIVSNPKHWYSYVFNAKYNTWYKISSRFGKSRIPNRFLRINGDETKNIIDYTSEVRSLTPFHIQTRPFRLAPNQYSSILRTILNVCSEIPDNGLVSAYLFASDNLSEWRCVSGAQKRGCTIRSIRMERCDRSYTHHVLMLGGNADSETEITNAVLTYENILNNKTR